MIKVAFRYTPPGALFDTSGPSMFYDDKDKCYYLLGMVNTVVMQKLIDIFCTGLHYSTGAVSRIPMIESDKEGWITVIVKECIDLSQNDWDSFETSWDFKIHPIVGLSKDLWDATAIGASMQHYYGGHPEASCPVELCYMLWQGECNERFKQLKENEEELNRIFIDIYGLQDELIPEVEDKDVTVRKADLQRDIKSLISYAVGCMFGRYSVDKEGLIYAGGDIGDLFEKGTNAKGLEFYYLKGFEGRDTFAVDMDNIIPITDEEYLEDDIVALFCEWVKKVFGEDSLEQNLDYIASALGNKGNTSRDIIRNYFLKDFFKDHCNTYSVTGSGKRPIYWLFDSGKQNGFKALIYLHRYNADTIGNLRVDYLHRMQRIYESEMDRMQDMIDNSTNNREVGAATKRKEKLQKQLKECREYDEKIGHLALSRIELDLDDGVKVNYRKIQTANDGQFYEVLADSKKIMAKEIKK